MNYLLIERWDITKEESDMTLNILFILFIYPFIITVLLLLIIKVYKYITKS